MSEMMIKEKEGWAWINNQQRPICAVRDIKRGKQKGKIQVTMCRGRNANGTINRGSMVVIEAMHIIEFPMEVS